MSALTQTPVTGKRGSIRKSSTKALAEARELAPELASRSTAAVYLYSVTKNHKNNQKLSQQLYKTTLPQLESPHKTFVCEPAVPSPVA